jgi:small subunit ribosomal protein S20
MCDNLDLLRLGNLDSRRANAYNPGLPPLGPGTQPESRLVPNVVIEERMANTASARKRIRQTVTRTARNQARKSRMRTFIKKVETAIVSGDKSTAAEALRAAQPEMQRASGKGVIHANTVGRKLSRLSARIKALPSA